MAVAWGVEECVEWGDSSKLCPQTFSWLLHPRLAALALSHLLSAPRPGAAQQQPNSGSAAPLVSRRANLGPLQFPPRSHWSLRCWPRLGQITLCYADIALPLL